MADAKLPVGSEGSRGLAGAWPVAEISRLRQRQTAPLILELDLTDGVPEGPATDPLSAVMSIRKVRLTDVLDGLRRARHDDRVRALVAKVGGARIGLARMQEIREAVAEFRASGKLTVAWAETFGEFTAGNLPYYLATAFDRVWLQPSGALGLTGVAVEQLFLHDALAKVGIGFQSAASPGPPGRALSAWRPRWWSSSPRPSPNAAARPSRTPARCSTGARSWPPTRWPRAWSTSSATGTRSTRRSARRRARARSCSTWGATSACTRWPSGPAACRNRASASSRWSTRPARSGRGAAAAARWAGAPWARTRWRPRCGRRGPTSGSGPCCCG